MIDHFEKIFMSLLTPTISILQQFDGSRNVILTHHETLYVIHSSYDVSRTVGYKNLFLERLTAQVTIIYVSI